MMAHDRLQILVVDDEPAIRRFLRAALNQRGHAVCEAADGGEALALAAAQLVDFVFLDLGLPDMDGVEVTRRLRQRMQTPVIVLSVRGEERSRLRALEAGADDWLTKPFIIDDLLERMEAVLRRTAQDGQAQAVFSSGALWVDLTHGRVLKDGCEVRLTQTEFDLLSMLVSSAGRPVTHAQLTAALWGGSEPQAAQILRMTIRSLRRKVETDPTRPGHILTEPGVGYRLRTGSHR